MRRGISPDLGHPTRPQPCPLCVIRKAFLLLFGQSGNLRAISVRIAARTRRVLTPGPPPLRVTGHTLPCGRMPSTDSRLIACALKQLVPKQEAVNTSPNSVTWRPRHQPSPGVHSTSMRVPGGALPEGFHRGCTDAESLPIGTLASNKDW